MNLAFVAQEKNINVVVVLYKKYRDMPKMTIIKITIKCKTDKLKM